MLKSRQRHEDTKSEDDISHQIIGAAIEVHRTLGGPGLLESIYESALVYTQFIANQNKAIEKN